MHKRAIRVIRSGNKPPKLGTPSGCREYGPLFFFSFKRHRWVERSDTDKPLIAKRRILMDDGWRTSYYLLVEVDGEPKWGILQNSDIPTIREKAGAYIEKVLVFYNKPTSSYKIECPPHMVGEFKNMEIDNSGDHDKIVFTSKRQIKTFLERVWDADFGSKMVYPSATPTTPLESCEIMFNEFSSLVRVISTHTRNVPKKADNAKSIELSMVYIDDAMTAANKALEFGESSVESISGIIQSSRESREPTVDVIRMEAIQGRIGNAMSDLRSKMDRLDETISGLREPFAASIDDLSIDKIITPEIEVNDPSIRKVIDAQAKILSSLLRKDRKSVIDACREAGVTIDEFSDLPENEFTRGLVEMPEKRRSRVSAAARASTRT